MKTEAARMLISSGYLFPENRTEKTRSCALLTDLNTIGGAWGQRLPQKRNDFTIIAAADTLSANPSQAPIFGRVRRMVYERSFVRESLFVLPSRVYGRTA